MADGYAELGGGDGDDPDDAARIERADASASRALRLAVAVIVGAFVGAAGTAWAAVNGIEGIVRGSKRGRTLGIVALVLATSGVLGGRPLGCSAGGCPVIGSATPRTEI